MDYYDHPGRTVLQVEQLILELEVGEHEGAHWVIDQQAYETYYDVDEVKI